MKKKESIIYLVDNYIYLHSQKEIIKVKLAKGILKNGKIADVKEFMKKYQQLIKQYNLNNSIFGENIEIIIHPDYSKAEKELLKNIFTSMNYRHINLTNEIKLYKLNNTKAFLNYNEEYAILSYINYYKEITSLLIPHQLFKTKELQAYIHTKIPNKVLYIIGRNSKIEEFINSYEENYHQEIYYFLNHETYLLDTINEK